MLGLGSEINRKLYQGLRSPGGLVCVLTLACLFIELKMKKSTFTSIRLKPKMHQLCFVESSLKMSEQDDNIRGWCGSKISYMPIKEANVLDILVS